MQTRLNQHHGSGRYNEPLLHWPIRALDNVHIKMLAQDCIYGGAKITLA